MSEPDFDSMTPEQIADYQRQNCIFCKIIKGEIPARKVYEDDTVVCILDIYPAGKGHMLLMPKNHYPFLPAVPPEVAKHMFSITKELSKAGKSAVITGKSTIFIANGSVSGQQSPHFIYHIVPREGSDGLDNFNVPSNDIPQADSDRVAAALRAKMSLGAQVATQQVPPKQSNLAQAQGVEERFAYLANMIMQNPELKQLMQTNPDGFKTEIKKYPDVEKLFEGIDIEKLAASLRRIE